MEFYIKTVGSEVIGGVKTENFHAWYSMGGAKKKEEKTEWLSLNYINIKF